ncbi:MAG TPA: hypothetical protein VFM55_04120 [Micromonosporaceae bacterium]|nr:hypothetical protein [Micromonosporaceae bacterium]
MTRRTRWIIATVAAGVVAVGVGGGVAIAGAAGEHDTPITGPARAKAEAAALAHTGGGRVTETEAGDEDSYYEVEVTLPDGRQVDVQLDEDFKVVGSTTDDERDDDGDGDDDGSDG